MGPTDVLLYFWYVEEIVMTLLHIEKFFFGEIRFFCCVPTMFSICSQWHYPISQCAQYMFPIVPHFYMVCPKKFPPSPREGIASSHRNFYFGELSIFYFIKFIFFVIDQSQLEIVVGMGGIIGIRECGGRAPN